MHRRIDVDHAWTTSGTWRATPAPGRDARLGVKRGLDLVVGVVLSLATLPLVLGLAVVSAAVLREWPFFVQDRIGRDHRRIPFIKIRTMPSRAVDPYALKGDWSSRDLPAVMRLLRRQHLDELPQLWLVVTGHLSLVGPRPRMPDDVEPVDRDYGELRVLVPQGCTCLWQIGPNTAGLPRDAPEDDYRYLLDGGVRLDLWILCWTALQMLGLARPRTMDDVPTWLRSRGWIDLDREQQVFEAPRAAQPAEPWGTSAA